MNRIWHTLHPVGVLYTCSINILSVCSCVQRKWGGTRLVTCTTFVLANCDLDLALMWDQVINVLCQIHCHTKCVRVTSYARVTQSGESSQEFNEESTIVCHANANAMKEVRASQTSAQRSPADAMREQ